MALEAEVNKNANKINTGTESWLSPLNKIIIHNACKKKEKQATLRNGTRFLLDYNRRSGFVHISPAPPSKELVPRGWLKLDKVTDPGWLAE